MAKGAGCVLARLQYETDRRTEADRQTRHTGRQAKGRGGRADDAA